MAEAKPIASLTSGLLARKGAATPAMRRPMLGFGRAVNGGMVTEDLGWNDMGFDVPTHDEEPGDPTPPAATGLTPMAVVVPVPAVVLERAELAERVAQTVPAKPVELAPVEAPVADLPAVEQEVVQAKPAPVRKAKPRAAVPQDMSGTGGRKAAFTLRLDAERHLKLRLAAAVIGRSSQQVVTEALDAFLNGLPEIDRLAQQLPRSRGGH